MKYQPPLLLYLPFLSHNRGVQWGGYSRGFPKIPLIMGQFFSGGVTDKGEVHLRDAAGGEHGMWKIRQKNQENMRPGFWFEYDPYILTQIYSNIVNWSEVQAFRKLCGFQAMVRTLSASSTPKLIQICHDF